MGPGGLLRKNPTGVKPEVSIRLCLLFQEGLCPSVRQGSSKRGLSPPELVPRPGSPAGCTVRRVPCGSWEPQLWVREAPFLCSCFPTDSSNPAAKPRGVPQVTLRSEDVPEGPPGCRRGGNAFWRAFEARGAGPRGKGPWHRHAQSLKKKKKSAICLAVSYPVFSHS